MGLLASFGNQAVETRNTTYIVNGFKLLNIASGPEVAYFWGLNGPLLPQNTLEKVGAFSLPTFPRGFAVGGGRLDPNNLRVSARRLY